MDFIDPIGTTLQRLPENLMNRGTLMVLKRFLTAALGALGLGALAAGPASAQEIPAPDLFDGQVACSMNVPTPPMYMAPTGSMAMTFGDAVTAKVMSGMAIEVDAMGVPTDANGNTDAHLANILYVINPENSNCGAGTYSQAEFDAAETALGSGMAGFEVGDAKPVEGQVAMDVGAGYSETLMKFMAANMADAEVKAAQDAQKAVDENAAQSVKDAAQKRVDDALAAQMKARDALAAVGMGPINMAGIAEWRAKGAVEMAISGWNSAVMMAGATKTAVDATDYNAKYVQVDNDQLLALVASGTDVEAENINLASLLQYANNDGMNVSTQDSMTGVITGASAFDALGNLLIPMELWDHDNDATTDQVLREAAVATATFDTLNTRREAVNAMVKALEDLQEGNQNSLLQEAIDVAVQRAKTEQAHVQGQFDKMIADNTDLRTAAELSAQYQDTDGSGTIEVDERTPGNEVDGITAANRTALYSMKTRYDAYVKAMTAQDNAGVTLQTAVTDREAATAAVRAAFTNPQDFYQQLVDRRSYNKDQKDAEVMRLAGLTGDDAPTEKETEDAAEAAKDAATALTDAQDIQSSFQDLLAEDSPVKDLVLETLKPDTGTDKDRGDDGQALVDAIVGVNNTANEAKTTADNTASMIEGLTGDDGEVSMNTTRSMKNESDIEALDGRVAMNEGEIWDEDGNSRIDQNEMDIMANSGRIDKNAMDIMANSGRIDKNEMDIMTNSGRIDQNEMDIMTNAGHVMENRGMIDANSGRIGANEMAISGLDSRVGANASAIGRNEAMIGELNESLEVVRAGVAASMALAGMPAINGRGISLGVGSFDGESAFAVGFQIQGEMASFKVGVTSAGGETGASAGVGFQF